VRRLVIVGSGVAGSTTKRIAEFYGWETILIDRQPEQAASRAALATIRPQWLGENGRAWANASWRWYERWNVGVTQHALVSSWKKPEPIRQKDWWLVEPISVLLPPDVAETVIEIQDTTAVTDTGAFYEGDALLVAVGSSSPYLYDDFKPMAGSTLYNDQIEMTGAPLRVHHLRPFHALTVAQQGNTVVLGSSISREPEKAEEEVWRMLSIAEDLGIVPKSDKWTLRTNVRATSPAPQLPVLGKRSTVIGSLSRSGYGITPHVVEQWIQSLS
jgi:glycine/D-amino acid oxidase-like deaminating enzyme